MLLRPINPEKQPTLFLRCQVLEARSSTTDIYGVIFRPTNFDPAKKYPLVISLHGASSNHRLNLRRVFGFSNKPGETDVEATRYFPQWKDIGYIVASPLARTIRSQGFQSIQGHRNGAEVLADGSAQ